MGRKQRAELRDKRPRGNFLPLPHLATMSGQWASLSSDSVRLLIDLLAEYPTRKRNGDLSAAWTLMKPRGWRSKRRLAAALRELEARRLTLTQEIVPI